jgi:hypothetical protein
VNPVSENPQLIEKPKWTVGENVAAVGHYRGETFDGGDTVPYDGGDAALAYWSEHLSHRPLTLLDGDRFSNAKVYEYFRTHARAPRTVCALLTAPDGVAAARRAARSSETQNATWVRGRATKARNFYGLFRDSVQLDATQAPDVLEAALRRYLSEPPPDVEPDESVLDLFG